MPIPPFELRGVLPAGIHECTLDEIKLRFGAFQITDRRPKLFQKLISLIEELRNTKIARMLLIDGSFVTSQRSAQPG